MVFGKGTKDGEKEHATFPGLWVVVGCTGSFKTDSRGGVDYKKKAERGAVCKLYLPGISFQLFFNVHLPGMPSSSFQGSWGERVLYSLHTIPHIQPPRCVQWGVPILALHSLGSGV